LNMEPMLQQDSPIRPAKVLGKATRFFSRAPKFPLAVVVLSILIASFAPLLAPFSPSNPDLGVRLQPPVFMEGGTAQHALGTDRQGRDIVSRVIYGTRMSLFVAALSIAFGGVVGTVLGLLAGYFGGWIDAVVMRAVDAMLAFPSIFIALIFVVNVGPSLWVVVGVLALILWSRYARLVRGEVLVWKQRDFIALARVAGCSPIRIMVVHILPNVVNSIIVLSTLQVGWVIIIEAALSFLGAGVPPPTPTWGGMVAGGRHQLDSAWWISVMPGIVIMLVVLAFNLLGDWLRDILDPKLNQL
jgi:peptide/nickel transport system permease protein